MGTERIYQSVLRVASAHAERNPIRTHLEIGPGGGRLITLFRERFGTETCACDYTDALLKLPGQTVDIGDLNQQKLPYATRFLFFPRINEQERRTGPVKECETPALNELIQLGVQNLLQRPRVRLDNYDLG